jgi:hypothetical protein
LKGVEEPPVKTGIHGSRFRDGHGMIRKVVLGPWMMVEDTQLISGGGGNYDGTLVGNAISTPM